MKKILCITATLVLCSSLFKTLVFAQDTKSTTITPSADATIIEGNPSHYGNAATLECEYDGETKSFLIRFDLGALPSNALVQTATLVLSQTNGSGDDISINVYKVTSSWSETSVSGTYKPSFESGVTYGVLNVNSSLGQKTFPQNFSDLVQSWLEEASSNFGLYFEASSSGTYTHEFSSREGASRPTLTINYSIPDTEGPTISNIKVTSIASSSAVITWDTSEEASSFVDYGETGDYGKIVGTEELTTTHSLDIDGLEADTTYFFRVRSEDAGGNESQSSTQTFKTLSSEEEEKSKDSVSDKISPPSDLRLASGKDDENYYVELSWEHSQDRDIDGYRVYRSKEDKLSYILLTEVDATKTSYKDEDIEVGQTYFYVVRAVKGAEESKDSNEEVITIYGSELEEELHRLNFWKGFIIFNIVVLPIFILLYLRYRKKALRYSQGKGVNLKLERVNSGSKIS